MFLMLALFFNPFGFDAVQYSLILLTGSLWRANFVLYCIAGFFFGLYIYYTKLSNKKKMQNPRLATRYAKSLLDLAVEKNSLEDTLKDMQLLTSICAQSHDFVVMLRSPVIAPDKKKKIIETLLEWRNVSKLTHAFVDLLAAKGREANLPEVAQAFQAQYNELKNIKLVNVTTATDMSDATLSSIKEKIAGYLPGDSIQLKTTVNEALIGGFVIEMDNKLYDASVRKKLNDFKSKVIDTTYESKIG